MKKFKFYSMMMATAAVTFLASCGGGTDDPPKPDPKVNLKNTTGYTSTSQTVAGDSVIKAGILINHDRKIKNIKFEVTVSGSTFTVKDTAVNNQVVDIDFVRQVITTPGTEGWTFTATDEDGGIGTASFILTVAAADQTLIPYEGNSAGTIDIYRFQSTQPKSALNLEDMGIYSAGTSVNDMFKDIYDNTATSADPYTPRWASKSGSQFVKVTGGAIDYQATTKYSTIVNYFNTKTPSATSENLVKGDLYVVKGGDKNRYHLVLVSEINDVAGVNTDFVTVFIKTIDITK